LLQGFLVQTFDSARLLSGSHVVSVDDGVGLRFHSFHFASHPHFLSSLRLCHLLNGSRVEFALFHSNLLDQTVCDCTVSLSVSLFLVPTPARQEVFVVEGMTTMRVADQLLFHLAISDQHGATSQCRRLLTVVHATVVFLFVTFAPRPLL